jgi:hypothetical protein
MTPALSASCIFTASWKGAFCLLLKRHPPPSRLKKSPIILPNLSVPTELVRHASDSKDDAQGTSQLARVALDWERIVIIPPWISTYRQHPKPACSRLPRTEHQTATQTALAVAKVSLQDGVKRLRHIAATATHTRKIDPWSVSLIVHCELVSQRPRRTGN